jgi:hypothetical protein
LQFRLEDRKTMNGRRQWRKMRYPVPFNMRKFTRMLFKSLFYLALPIYFLHRGHTTQTSPYLGPYVK